jgi:hypothetical protein
MSSFRKNVTRQKIKSKTHFLEQKDILMDNLINISYSTISILKNTLLRNYDIQINGMSKTLCNFFKFLTANMCGITELSAILTMFFSFLANLIIPKKLNPIKLTEINDLLENQIREEKVQEELDEYEPLDKQATINLRKNLIIFMEKLVNTYPETKRDVYPLCDISKYLTDKVCNLSVALVPFMVFIRLLTHSVIPDDVVEMIVHSLSRPIKNKEIEPDEFDKFSDNILEKKLADERGPMITINNIEPSAPPLQQTAGNNKKKRIVYKSRK